MDYYLHSPSRNYNNHFQTIFAIRGSSTNYIFLTAQYDSALNYIRVLVQEQTNYWANVLTTTTIIQKSQFHTFAILSRLINSLFVDTWIRLIFELVQAQPIEFATGFYSARIWVGSSVTARAYFGGFTSSYKMDLSQEKLIIDLCSTKISGTAVRDTVTEGYYDVRNFRWFYGAESLFAPTSGMRFRICFC